MNTSIESLESRIAPASLLNVSLSKGVLSITGSTSSLDVDNLRLDLAKVGSDALLRIANTGGNLRFGGDVMEELELTKSEMSSLKSISIDLGAGANSAVFTIDTGTSLNAPIAYRGGIGADTLTFGSDTKSFTTPKDFTASLGGGNDRVIFTHDSRFDGNTTLDLGAGDDALLTETAGPNTSPVLSFTNLTVLGGDGNDSLALGLQSDNNRDLNISGALTVDAGKGANDVSLFGNNVLIGTTTLQSKARDKDFDVSISAAQRLAASGSISVATSGAEPGQTNEFRLEAPSILISGRVVYTGGAGADAVAVGTESSSVQTIISGSVSVNNGDGNNSTAIGQSNAALAVGATISVTGGNQADNLTVLAASGAVNSGVGATLGKGANAVSIRSDGQFNVGRLGISSRSSAAEADSLSLRGVVLNGYLNATLGEGNSTVDIAQVTALGFFTLRTGAGNDIVQIDSDGRAGASTFFRPVILSLGDGADKLQIGGDSARDEAVFMNNLSVYVGRSDALDEVMGFKLGGLGNRDNARAALLAQNTFLGRTAPLLSRG